MFAVAGISKLEGQVKVRFANDMTRVKVLSKGGHTEVFLMELPQPMDKPAVVKYLMTTELMDTPEYAEALEVADEKYSGEKAVRQATLKTGVAKPAKVTKVKKDSVAIDPAAKMAELKARAGAVTE